MNKQNADTKKKMEKLSTQVMLDFLIDTGFRVRQDSMSVERSYYIMGHSNERMTDNHPTGRKAIGALIEALPKGQNT